MAIYWDKKSVTILKKLYLSFDLPSDKLAANAKEKKRFSQQFNQKSELRVTGDELVGKLIALRKKGELPTLRK